MFDWLSVGQQFGVSVGLVCDSGLLAYWNQSDSLALRDPVLRRRFAVQQAVWAWVDHLLFFSKDRLEPPPPDAPYAVARVRVKLLDPNADPRPEDDPEPPALLPPAVAAGGVAAVTAMPVVAPWLEAGLTGPPPGPACGRFMRAVGGTDGDYDAHIARAAYAAMLSRVCARRAGGAAVVARPLMTGSMMPIGGGVGLPDRVVRHNRPADLLREYRDCGGVRALCDDLRLRYARALAAFC